MFRLLANNEIKNFNLGFTFFNIGIFLLASAPFISIICILISSFISAFSKKEFEINKFNSFQNIILIICCFIFLINSSISFLSDIPSLVGEDKFKILIDLFNWIPFFIIYFLIKPYLKKSKQREITSFLLLIGSLPVIFSGFGQYFLGWDEPMKTLNGYIIWFLKPIDQVKGLSGLFSNSNYAASWLSLIWPFSIIFFLKLQPRDIYKRITSLLYISLIFISMILTNSKDTLLGIILPIPILLKSTFFKNKSFLLITISTFFIFLSNLIFLLIRNEINLNYILDIFPRIDIWRVSLIAIFEKPIFGWGASKFPFIYDKYKYKFINDNIQHSHNLFFEISINYGLIASILISLFIIYLLINSYKKIGDNNYYIDLAWWVATISFLINQIFDVTYYDLRISMFFWILIAGLDCIITENKQLNKLKIKNS